jgi:hypothetical protein
MASATISTQGKALYAWTGSEWIPLNGSQDFANVLRWHKISEGGETSLSGLDDEFNELIYTPGYEQVYLNGILLVKDFDYTATNGTTITNLDALNSGDVINIIALNSINIANTYTKAQADSRYATLANLQGEINDILDNAPAALDTLNELSAALNDDPNFYSTIASVYQKMIPYSSTTPENPEEGDLWVDSSTAPPALKTYDGTNWVQLGAAVDDSQAIIAGRMFA